MSKSIKKLEILLVVITAIGKFVFMDYLDWKLGYISIAVIFWVIYALVQIKKNPERAKLWGFRKDTFKPALRVVYPFGFFAVVTCVAIGWYNETLNFSWHIIPILIIYPIWGLIQQFLLISLVTGNLKDMNIPRLSDIWIILITSTLFSAIHYPYFWLAFATFFLALFYGTVFLKVRNIFVLGLFHGWLGAICFYTIVDRDPFIEVFGKYI